MERLIAQESILKTLYQFADAEDNLDQSLLLSLFIPRQSFTFDMSSHLGAAPMEITPTQFYDQLILSLSGFTATQHLLSNPLIEFDDENPSKARAKVKVCAHHVIEAERKGRKCDSKRGDGHESGDVLRKMDISKYYTDTRGANG